jgi:hypothetical protein
MFLLTRPEATLSILQWAEAKHIGSAGYGYLLSQKASWFEPTETEDTELTRNGLLVVVEDGLEYLTSSAAYNSEALVKMMRCLYSDPTTSISNQLESRDISTYKLVNIQNNVRVVVASF